MFQVPKESLLATVEYGYLDDLLIGNFMKVRLVNTRLYPRFTPLVAKLGGNAKVYTTGEYYRFLWRYFRRNPVVRRPRWQRRTGLIGAAFRALSNQIDRLDAGPPAIASRQ